DLSWNDSNSPTLSSGLNARSLRKCRRGQAGQDRGESAASGARSFMIWETFSCYARKILPHTKNLPDHEPGISMIARNARAGSSGPALPRAHAQPPVPRYHATGPCTATITPPAITTHTTTDQHTNQQAARSLPFSSRHCMGTAGTAPALLFARWTY